MHPHDFPRSSARSHLVARIGITLLTASCGGTSGTSNESTTVTDEPTVEEPTDPSDPTEPGIIDFPLIPEATYGETDGVRL